MQGKMTVSEFYDFLDEHGVKEKFIEEYKELKSPRDDIDVEVSLYLRKNLSPILYMTDFCSDRADWNHLDDLFDLKIRGMLRNESV